jgi:hypothetical protein
MRNVLPKPPNFAFLFVDLNSFRKYMYNPNTKNGAMYSGKIIDIPRVITSPPYSLLSI